MNILRHIDMAYGKQPDEGTLVDFEYTQDEEKNFKWVDVRLHTIVNNVVGEKLDINIINKLTIVKKMLEYLEYEKNKKQTDNDDV